MFKVLMSGIVTMSLALILSVSAFAENAKTLSGGEICKTQCSKCHSLDKVKANFGKDAKFWNETVDRMISNGATLSADEKVVLVKYLSEKKKI